MIDTSEGPPVFGDPERESGGGGGGGGAGFVLVGEQTIRCDWNDNAVPTLHAFMVPAWDERDPATRPSSFARRRMAVPAIPSEPVFVWWVFLPLGVVALLALLMFVLARCGS